MKKRRSLLVFMLCMIVFTALSVNASEEPHYLSGYVNPVYEEYAYEYEPIRFVTTYSEAVVSDDVVYYDTISGAGNAVLQGMLLRDETITVGYCSPVENSDYIIDIFFNAFEHTGVPNSGDYLRYTLGGFYWDKFVDRIGDDFFYTITYYPIYFTTAEQEAEMDLVVADVLRELGLEEKNEFEKISAIYDYICSNVTYDHANLENDSYKLKHTAYAALINGTAVCQGYATLFYRLALEAGLDARVITGYSYNQNHAWNIVKIGDVYYNLDSTWDSDLDDYKYFLKCNNNFPNHVRSAEMTTQEFSAKHPMSGTDYENSFKTGKCGDNLVWTFDSNGVLTISGTGKMSDYGWKVEGTSQFAVLNKPWNSCGPVKKIIVNEGVTSIGFAAFYQEKELEEIVFHDNSIVEIGMHAFQEIALDNGLILPNSLKTISERAFQGAAFNGTLDFGNSLQIIDEYAFMSSSGIAGDMIFPDSLKKIGNAAFPFCKLSGGITLGSSLEYIGDSAFYQCGLTGDLIIPDSVLTIGSAAFNTNNFTGDLIIGNGITSFAQGTFPVTFTGKLKLSENLTVIKENTFYGAAFSGDLIIPDSVKTIESHAFSDAAFDGKLLLGKGLTNIGSSAFIRCGFTGDLVIPDQIENIESAAFAYCGFNGSLTIGSGLKEIKNQVFRNCGFTGTLVIPDTVTYIGSSSFTECPAIEEVIFGTNITELQPYAFSKCSALKAVYFCENLQTLGNSCFLNCISLKSVYFQGKPPVSMSKYEFYCLSKDSVLYLPKDLVFYYVLGQEGWTTPKWNGYNTSPIKIESDVPGDMDGDDQLTPSDLIYFSNYWSGYPGHSIADIPIASLDLDSDGFITRRDKMILERHFADWSGYEVLPLPSGKTN